MRVQYGKGNFALNTFKCNKNYQYTANLLFNQSQSPTRQSPLITAGGVVTELQHGSVVTVCRQLTKVITLPLSSHSVVTVQHRN